MDAVADVQALLRGLGLVDGTTGWPSIRRRGGDRPGDSATVAAGRLVVIAEDGGAPPTGVRASSGLGDGVLRDLGVMVQVRGGPWEGDEAAAEARAILEALDGWSGVTPGGQRVLRIVARTSGPVWAGYDERGRPWFSVAIRLMVEAAA